MFRDKLRTLITQDGVHSLTDYAKYIGRTKQSLNTKMLQNAFDVFDLIDVMEFTGSHLVVCDEEGEKVFEITRDDLEIPGRAMSEYRKYTAEKKAEYIEQERKQREEMNERIRDGKYPPINYVEKVAQKSRSSARKKHLELAEEA